MARFKVGDKVKVGGKAGVVVEVAVHDKHWLADNPQLYSVKMSDRAKKSDGSDADHKHDTLGAVEEKALQPG
jgi:hypothetical protein